MGFKWFARFSFFIFHSSACYCYLKCFTIELNLYPNFWIVDNGTREGLDKFLKAASTDPETVLHYEFMQDYKVWFPNILLQFVLILGHAQPPYGHKYKYICFCYPSCLGALSMLCIYFYFTLRSPLGNLTKKNFLVKNRKLRIWKEYFRINPCLMSWWEFGRLDVIAA